MEVEYADRYTALGITPSGCKGPCEGTGWVPVKGFNVPGGLNSKLDDDPVLMALWKKAEEENPSDDGWHFVPCPTCSSD